MFGHFKEGEILIASHRANWISQSFKASLTVVSNAVCMVQ